MALTTFRLTFLPRLRDGRQVRRYRQYMLESNTLAPSTLLLKHLERLPLQVSPAKGGDMQTLRAALAINSQIRLIVRESSEGLLALKQLCLQWAYGMEIEHTYFPLLISLPQVSDHDTPMMLLRNECDRLGFESDDLSLKRGLAAGIWLFLLDGWDDLDEPQKQKWSFWIEGCIQRFPAVCVVLPTVKTTPILNDFEPWKLHHISNH